MRIFATCLCTGIVQHAVIVGHEEGTRHFLENIVAILINAKILSNKCRFFHFQMSSHASYIVLYETRTKSTTAIGTLQAIYFLRFFIVQTMEQCIQLLTIQSLKALYQIGVFTVHSYSTFTTLCDTETPSDLMLTM